METLTSDLAIRVREKLPEDVNAAARAADVIVEAKRACSSKRPPPTNHQGRPGLQPKTQREGRALAVLMPDPVTPVIIGNHLELETGEEVRVPVYGVGPAACSVQTRAQSRKSGPTPLSVSEPTLGGVGPKALARMQREDDTLKRVRQNADSGQEFRGKSGVVSFQWYKDLLYRTYKGTTGTYRQLVVPKELRSEVLRLAHDPPMAGHMGAKRTRERAWTSFYWPGMAADVRRFNATLKGMLKKCCQEKPKNWDRFIPAVLFAYREVPQESLGFSPFELLYGRTVLLLLPGKANKLEVSWQGPFVVMGKKGVNDYRIQIGEKERLYHINVLKRYVERGDKPQSDHETKTVRVSTAVVEEGPEEVGFAASTIPLIPLQASEGPEQVNLDPSYPELHEELRSICSEFRDVLTDAPNSTSLDECEIVVLSEQPVRTQQYPLPHAMRRTVEDEVDSMLKLGVIERAASPYSSPIVLVKKPDGKIRFCVDFRKLNKQVEFDAEPMPDVDYLFAKIGKAKYLSKLDLSKGYWQVPLREEDKPKTAFTTPGGQYQWRVMPFGLKTAGAIFSRMMRKLLAPLNRSDIDNFMDDVLIANEAKEEHMDALRALFLRLREVRLSARPSKCFLGFRELEYLGHRVGSGKLWPVDSKVDKIRGAARPTTKKELRAFLGLAGFLPSLCAPFSEIALALTDKTKGGQPNKVKWDENCERAFQTLKARLCSSPVVCLPQSDLPYILRTDASEKGLGAVLLQDQGQGPQPVAYASKKLTGPELNYSVIEKECLAVVWGIEKFDPYLYGKTFVLETDHQPLQHLDRVKLANAKTSNGHRIRKPSDLRRAHDRLTYVAGAIDGHVWESDADGVDVGKTWKRRATPPGCAGPRTF
nr:hypothetical protein BaRGS_030978 [Batillaria attramentaria]